MPACILRGRLVGIWRGQQRLDLSYASETYHYALLARNLVRLQAELGPCQVMEREENNKYCRSARNPVLLVPCQKAMHVLVVLLRCLADGKALQESLEILVS